MLASERAAAMLGYRYDTLDPDDDSPPTRHSTVYSQWTCRSDSSPSSRSATPPPPSSAKRRHDDVATDSATISSSAKRTKVTSLKSQNPQQLPTPEATPAKPVKHSEPGAPSTISPLKNKRSRQLSGKELLAKAQPVNKTPTKADASDDEEDDEPAETPTKTKKYSPLAARSEALRERLAKKQKAREAQKPPPTPAEAKRIAALQRAADVARIITPVGSASNGNVARASHSSRGLAQLVMQSAANVLGEQEVVDVLRLLEKEGAALGCAGFVKFVPIGRGEAVVVQAAKKPKPSELRERVKELLQAYD